MEELATIIENVKPSIVVLKTPQGKSGSGFFVNEKGLFITNKHITGMDTFIKVSSLNTGETDARVVFADNDVDFAFALADVNESIPITLADSSAVQEGQQVVAIGHPYGYDFTISKGIISSKNRVVKGIKYIQTDVPINPGNSGGPLITMRGEAVGINTWVVSGADNMSFAIPVNSINDMIVELNEKHGSLLSMYYCPICGSLDDDLVRTWKAEYCRNCGARKIEKTKPQEQEAAAQQAQPVTVAMVTCPQCQTPNEGTSNFCKNCGNKMK